MRELIGYTRRDGETLKVYQAASQLGWDIFRDPTKEERLRYLYLDGIAFFPNKDRPFIAVSKEVGQKHAPDRYGYGRLNVGKAIWGWD